MARMGGPLVIAGKVRKLTPKVNKKEKVRKVTGRARLRIKCLKERNEQK
jgi:ribosomal protein S30